MEEALKKAYLWEEVKDRLHEPAVRLSGGQQQRLCIARTLAVGPEVILYDEPCSGLDPISTAKVEDAMQQLKGDYTQILVTNNTKQAARVSERCAFFLMGELVEIGPTDTTCSPTRRTNARTTTSPADSDNMERETENRDGRPEPVLRDFQALKDVNIKIPAQERHGDHRPFRLRQVHPAAVLQPDERPDRDTRRARAGSSSTARTSSTRRPT